MPNASDGSKRVGAAGLVLGVLLAILLAAPTAIEARPPYWLQPVFSVSRDVQRNGNVYQIDLRLTNGSTATTISDIVVTDTSYGVQCVADPMVINKGYPPCTVYSNDDQGLSSVIKVTFPTPWTLGPGESMRLRYYAVPIMYELDSPIRRHRIIGEELKVTYKYGGQQRLRELPGLAWNYGPDLADAFQSADYLIVTVPPLLYQHYNQAEVDALMAQMGRLAKYKDGVLGYSDPLSFYRLRGLIGFGGNWSSRLTPFWTTRGYLLLVGEANIIPHRPTFKGPWGDGTKDVVMSDYFYSNLSNMYCGDEKPELRVGRIIGKSAADLAIPIRVSLEVMSGIGENDGSNAFLISGHEKIGDAFAPDVESGAQYLRDVKGASAGCVNTEYFSFQEKILHKAIIHKGLAAGGADKCSKACNPRPCKNYDCLNNYSRTFLAQWMLTITTGPPSLPIDNNEVWAACFEAAAIENARRGLNLPYIYMPDANASVSLARSAIQYNMPGKDLIMYDGHAGGGGWSCFGDEHVEGANITSKRTRPMVLSFGCSAGVYVGNSISCAFLKHGAGVFAGATQMINTSDGRRHIRDYGLLQFWGKNRRVGDILYDWKNYLESIKEQNGCDHRLLYVYNLYGDPKFGGSSTGGGESASLQHSDGVSFAGPPPDMVLVEIPDYEVTTIAGFDEVTIPGGEIMVLEEGTPEVPYLVKEYRFPAEYRIQDVSMLLRTNVSYESGLNLPLVLPDWEPLNDPRDSSASPQSHPSPTDDAMPIPTASEALFPSGDFDWNVSYNDEGSTATLAIAVYPFHYDVASKRSSFYQSYEFAIEYVQTTVDIDRLYADKTVYTPGDTVNAYLWLGNSGAPQEVTVEADVYGAFGGPHIEELPDVVIPSLGATDVANLDWSTLGLPTGDYRIQVKVKNALGELLDCFQLVFRVGASLGSIQRLTVTPKHFNVGDPIQFSLDFANAGDTELIGECVFLVTKGDEVVAEIVRNMDGLAPGDSTAFVGSWDSSDAEGGAVYTVVGAVHYDGMASEAQSDTFSTNLAPTAAFSFSPPSVIVDRPIAFDASSSTDPDGTILSYHWDFDDGVESGLSGLSHTYHQPGDYNVRMTVTDNMGGTDTIVQQITLPEARARDWIDYR